MNDQLTIAVGLFLAVYLAACYVTRKIQWKLSPIKFWLFNVVSGALSFALIVIGLIIVELTI